MSTAVGVDASGSRDATRDGQRRPVGRPRSQGPSGSGLAPRADVLRAAAVLFAERGFTATSTRAIAERAGLRQASLYHHFPAKEDILAALLEQSVSPSLAFAAQLTGHDPEADLWALARFDLIALHAGAQSLGILWVLPEVTSSTSGRFAAFHRQRTELWAIYRRLIESTGRCGGREERTSQMVFALVEHSTLQGTRSDTAEQVEDVADAVADGVLRLVGCDDAAIALARGEVPTRS